MQFGVFVNHHDMSIALSDFLHDLDRLDALHLCSQLALTINFDMTFPNLTAFELDSRMVFPSLPMFLKRHPKIEHFSTFTLGRPLDNSRDLPCLQSVRMSLESRGLQECLFGHASTCSIQRLFLQDWNAYRNEPLEALRDSRIRSVRCLDLLIPGRYLLAGHFEPGNFEGMLDLYSENLKILRDAFQSVAELHISIHGFASPPITRVPHFDVVGILYDASQKALLMTPVRQ